MGFCTDNRNPIAILGSPVRQEQAERKVLTFDPSRVTHSCPKRRNERGGHIGASSAYPRDPAHRRLRRPKGGRHGNGDNAPAQFCARASPHALAAPGSRGRVEPDRVLCAGTASRFFIPHSADVQQQAASVDPRMTGLPGTRASNAPMTRLGRNTAAIPTKSRSQLPRLPLHLATARSKVGRESACKRRIHIDDQVDGRRHQCCRDQETGYQLHGGARIKLAKISIYHATSMIRIGAGMVPSDVRR
jgi:hypothetical protein